MPINILMPALSPTMEKGNLAKWLKKEGDPVKTGDVIAEIETDKATMEYEAVDDGTLAKIVVPEGTQDVAVNQLIAVMAQEGEDVKAAACGSREGRAHGAAASCGRTGGAAPAPQAKAPPPHPLLRPRRNRRLLRQRPRPTAMRAAKPAACSRRRWRGGWRRTPASISAASRAPAHMAASSRATWHGESRRRIESARGAGRRHDADDRAVDVGSADPRALRRRQLRGRAA